MDLYRGVNTNDNMIINLQVNGQSLALTAPIGAAAFAVNLGENTLKVIFCMMKAGETGLDALNRILDANTTLDWTPVAARPEEQLTVGDTENEFVEYAFTWQGDAWHPATSTLANFMMALAGVQALPLQAPSQLKTSINAFLKKLKTT